jgi:hypothetical protein
VTRHLSYAEAAACQAAAQHLGPAPPHDSRHFMASKQSQHLLDGPALIICVGIVRFFIRGLFPAIPVCMWIMAAEQAQHALGEVGHV